MGSQRGSIGERHYMRGRRARAKRTELATVVALGEEMSERERGLVKVVADLQLATHAQLASLIAIPGTAPSAESAARSARRTLARLTDAGLLGRLDRRIGGVRAGSSGYIYYLGPVGQRLVAYWDGKGRIRGRSRPEPGGRFVRHRLAVSQLFVEAQRLRHRGRLDLVGFDLEPACWRTFADRRGRQVLLKPDALIRTRVHAREHQSFVEVDMATESRPVIARKVHVYMEYFLSGDSTPTLASTRPRVLLLTPSSARRALIMEICATLSPGAQRQFAVDTLERGLEILCPRTGAPVDL